MLSEQTIRKMRAVIAAILAEPELYDQDISPSGATDCNSVCCAAGWVYWLNDPEDYAARLRDDRKYQLSFNAPKLLGIDVFAGHNLFDYAYNWPEPYASQYAKATTPLGKAKVLEARWEHFIAVDGKEAT